MVSVGATVRDVEDSAAVIDACTSWSKLRQSCADPLRWLIGESMQVSLFTEGPKQLLFKVAPHIVQDLGLNLYTSLHRVLVEFVANAYDADSPWVRLDLDHDAITAARENMRKSYNAEKILAQGKDAQPPPLATRILPDSCTITISDQGFGMSREELDSKFLVAGRRRRTDDAEFGSTTPKGRAVMGRKGLGKLAGFGVAKCIEIVTRKEGESHATKVALDYDELIRHAGTDQIPVEEEVLADGGGIDPHGTRITLRRLMYDPLKSRATTIEEQLAEHFALIQRDDFAININGEPVIAIEKPLAFAWPEPDTALDAFITKVLAREDGGEVTFSYRLRFTKEGEALPAQRRGIRVYARKRLAAAPSLLAADTNMHGFRMTDYLDGVVHADFIDAEETDYIATDRQSLRWESPLLSDLHNFLSGEIKKACYEAQRKRDAAAPAVVKVDPFTVKEIAKYSNFSKKDKAMALRFAVTLKKACKQGVDDPLYQEQLPALIRGLGHGRLLVALRELAAEATPALERVSVEITRLMAEELDQFVSTALARLDAITALQKIVLAVDFKASRKEKEVQVLFERAAWLVDPTYTQFLSADVTLETLFERLAKTLKIGKHAGAIDTSKADRPDLVSLVGSGSLARLVIIEIKAPNVPLASSHLDQLQGYMESAEQWLGQHGRPMQVFGQLIGSWAEPDATGKEQQALRRRVKREGRGSEWRVRDFVEVLGDAEAAHRELIEVYRKHHADDDADDETTDGVDAADEPREAATGDSPPLLST